VIGIDGHIRAADLEGRQDGDDHPERAGHADPDPVLRPDAARPQAVSGSRHGRAELPVAEPPVAVLQRRPLGEPGGRPGEESRQRHRCAAAGPGPAPLLQRGHIVRAEHVQLAEARVRAADDCFQQIFVVPEHRVDRRRGELAAVVLDLEFAVAVVLGGEQRQAELRGVRRRTNPLGVDPGQRQRVGSLRAGGEPGVEEGCRRVLALRGQRLHDLLVADGRVVQRVEEALLNGTHGLAERQRRRRRDPQDDGVQAVPDDILCARPEPVRDRSADGQVRLAGVDREQARPCGQLHGEHRAAEIPLQLPQTVRQTGRQCPGSEPAAPGAQRPRPPVIPRDGRQVDLLGDPGQPLAPVGQLTGAHGLRRVRAAPQDPVEIVRSRAGPDQALSGDPHRRMLVVLGRDLREQQLRRPVVDDDVVHGERQDELGVARPRQQRPDETALREHERLGPRPFQQSAQFSRPVREVEQLVQGRPRVGHGLSDFAVDGVEGCPEHLVPGDHGVHCGDQPRRVEFTAQGEGEWNVVCRPGTELRLDPDPLLTRCQRAEAPGSRAGGRVTGHRGTPRTELAASRPAAQSVA